MVVCKSTENRWGISMVSPFFLIIVCLLGCSWVVCGEVFAGGNDISHEILSKEKIESSNDVTIDDCIRIVFKSKMIKCKKALQICGDVYDSGDQYAGHLLGLIYYSGYCDKNYCLAKEYFLKSSSNGVAASDGYLANMYMIGLCGEKNLYKSFQYATKAAARGDARGKYILGLFYMDGVNVDKDESTGRRLIQEAADMGYKPAIRTSSELK